MKIIFLGNCDYSNSQDLKILKILIKKIKQKYHNNNYVIIYGGNYTTGNLIENKIEENTQVKTENINKIFDILKLIKPNRFKYLLGNQDIGNSNYLINNNFDIYNQITFNKYISIIYKEQDKYLNDLIFWNK